VPEERADDKEKILYLNEHFKKLGTNQEEKVVAFKPD
jgi:hypothetical protein